MVDPIGARHHSMQRLRRLSRRRSARSDEGAFVVDGPILLGDALDAGVVVDEVVATPACPQRLLDRAAAAGAVVHRTRETDLGRVVDAVTPQGVAAVARFQDRDAADLAATARPLTLVLVGVSDPGNAGTLMRSAEAAGAGAVLFCDGSVDPYGPKCVRSSAGAVFRLEVSRDGDAGVALGALARAGVGTVATLARGAMPYDQADLAGPVAIVLGSEAHGLPASVAAAVDVAVTIPMQGRAESLNVAMAGTILCFEALRQRRARGAAHEQGNQLDETPPRAAGCTTT
jgi:TrmH family RNA methyltransferase